MKKLLLYTDTLGPKLKYVLDFLCDSFLDCDYELTDDINYFLKANKTIKLAYSKIALDGILSIPYSSYFKEFSKEVIPNFEETLSIENDKCNFDVFGAAFYLLARVEEYNDIEKDNHGRFNSKLSILSQKELLEKPVIDQWFEMLKKAIELKYSIELAVNRKFVFKSTIDIDHIFAYVEKPMFVRLGSMLKDIFTFKIQRLKDRFIEIDPYDTFDTIIQFHTQFNLRLHSFILCSKRGPYDKSLKPSHPSFIKKVSLLSSNGTIGIHPSYASDSKVNAIQNEKNKLEKIINSTIVSSRQHFVKLSFPQTYRSLIHSGIKDDYSMGYPDHSGFRAGTSQTFKWYDLEYNKPTDLNIHPFQLMDVTLKNYEHLKPNEAISKAESIITEVKKVKGTICLIWHNSSFYETEGWSGWKEVYEKILTMANQKNNNTLDSK